MYSLEVLREPVICRDGHTMCKACLDTALSGTFPTCPVDRTYLGSSTAVRNLALQSLIMGFTIKCPNGSGCSWKGKLEALQSHRNECDMEMVACVNAQCRALLYRFEMRSHEEQCPLKSEPCAYCGKKENAAEMVLHLKTCPKVGISCPNNCGVNILRYFNLGINNINEWVNNELWIYCMCCCVRARRYLFLVTFPKNKI